MAISFTKVGSLVVAQLNAAGTYTTTPTDPRFYTQQIKDAINDADAFVVALILGTAGHPALGSFLPTSSVVAHLGTIPAHIGPIVAVTVDGKGAQEWPKTEIEAERSNALSLTKYDKHFWIDSGSLLYHNGTSASVFYRTFVQSVADPPTLQSPEEYAEAVACRALAFLFSVEGENTPVAQHYNQMWRDFEALIKAGIAPSQQV